MWPPLRELDKQNNTPHPDRKDPHSQSAALFGLGLASCPARPGLGSGCLLKACRTQRELQLNLQPPFTEAALIPGGVYLIPELAALAFLFTYSHNALVRHTRRVAIAFLLAHSSVLIID